MAATSDKAELLGQMPFPAGHRQARLLVAPLAGWDHCQAVLLSLL